MNADMPLSLKEVSKLSNMDLLRRFERLVSDSREWRVDEDVIHQVRTEILKRMREKRS